ncbi:flagellin [Poseidonocella pacifica]|uniref:Flagellin n=1 Tax=Poseidonocella pacifica TaxID=871651 RepID=A0A1I0XX66_9RHOB|nr:flagellin [Poseidonocella pacifica]SFB05524.1 flagellin [Poseidonocella pacifica]
MSSILTNNSAMVALQTLKSINGDLSKTQSMISTGKSVASAKDNAATWAISKVMESDVAGFSAISDSLSLGESTIAVASNAAETVTDLLTEIKGKITSAQESNVDRDKIQTDIDALKEQITSVVGAAQFNGLNLLSNTDTTVGSGTVNVMSSLDRADDGSVTANSISVVKQDLGTQEEVAGTKGTNVGSTATIADGASGVIATLAVASTGDASGQVGGGQTFEVSGTNPYGLSAAVSYVARDGDTLESATAELVDRLNAQAAEDGLDSTFSTTSTAGEIQFNNESTLSVTATSAAVAQDDGSNLDGEIGGGLAALSDIDVSSTASDDDLSAALTSIESLIQTSIDSAATLGSSQKRVEIQNDFVGKLMDSMNSGIGSLVDADMEETSARLQALQVQQQLGVQSLSIANQAPQQILSLFR